MQPYGLIRYVGKNNLLQNTYTSELMATTDKVPTQKMQQWDIA
jgi:hypothetical protein